MAKYIALYQNKYKTTISVQRRWPVVPLCLGIMPLLNADNGSDRAGLLIFQPACYPMHFGETFPAPLTAGGSASLKGVNAYFFWSSHFLNIQIGLRVNYTNGCLTMSS